LWQQVRESQLTNYLESNATLGQLALAPCARALIAGVAELLGLKDVLFLISL